MFSANKQGAVKIESVALTFSSQPLRLFSVRDRQHHHDPAAVIGRDRQASAAHDLKPFATGFFLAIITLRASCSQLLLSFFLSIDTSFAAPT